MKVEPNTEFDWGMYADATFAGLSALIPLPIVDWMFEEFFRRRIPTAVARNRSLRLSPDVLTVLNENSDGCLAGCLTLPFLALWEIAKRLSRKILYVLAIKDASDKVSRYWHQAFLMDYMLAQGHLETWQSARIARKAMDGVLRRRDTSPLVNLAGSIVSEARHVFRSLWRVRRRGTEDDMITEQRRRLGRRWEDYVPYLKDLAESYDQAYLFVKENDPVEKKLTGGDHTL